MRFLRFAPSLVVAILFEQSCFSEPAAGDGILNVIVLSVDALNAVGLPPYGAEEKTLPNLERFSRRAVVFRNAFTTASWTLPAHASLLTGLYPDRHGVVSPGKRLAKDQETLASLLRAEGFETVAFTGGGFLSSSFGFGHGFDRYDGWTATRGWRRGLRLHQAGKEDGRLFDRAIAYLDDVDRENRRFLLFLHTYFVHDYYKKYDENEELKECVLGQRSCGAEIWDELKERYQERIAAFDEGFGRLLAAMDETGLDESTLVILLSDHGEGFEPNRGRIHHGGRLDEDVIRIPLLVVGPQLTHRFVDESVSLVDVLPTLAEMFVLSTSENYDGLSFARYLYGDPPPQISARARTIYAMEHAYRWVDGAREDFRALDESQASYAVVYRNFYYIRQGDREHVYDMNSDPEQQRDLTAGSFDTSPFRRALEMRAQFKGGGEAMQMDRELEEQLRSLGYIR